MQSTINRLLVCCAPFCAPIKKPLGYQGVDLHLADWTGLEPATSGVTGRHSNQTELPDLNLLMAMGILY